MLDWRFAARGALRKILVGHRTNNVGDYDPGAKKGSSAIAARASRTTPLHRARAMSADGAAGSRGRGTVAPSHPAPLRCGTPSAGSCTTNWRMRDRRALPRWRPRPQRARQPINRAQVRDKTSASERSQDRPAHTVVGAAEMRAHRRHRSHRSRPSQCRSLRPRGLSPARPSAGPRTEPTRSATGENDRRPSRSQRASSPTVRCEPVAWTLRRRRCAEAGTTLRHVPGLGRVPPIPSSEPRCCADRGP